MTAVGVRTESSLSRPSQAAVLAAAAAAADVAFDPAHHHVPLCPFHAVTGMWCPLCGGLRAGYALLHGDLASAARDNILLVMAIPLLVLAWLDWAQRTRTGRPARRLTLRTGIALGAIAVVFTVVRNLPGLAALRP